MINLKKQIPLKSILISLLVSIMIIVILIVLNQLSLSTDSLGLSLLMLNQESTQSANAVTSVVTYFRGLDTLGEVTILYLSVFGVSLGLKNSINSKNIFSDDNILLQTGVKVLFPLIVMFGFYIIIHGHLSPGGGFAGGVIIASGFLLRFLAIGDEFMINHKLIVFFESLSGVMFVFIGIAGFVILDMFFANFLPLGNITELFSGGLLAVIYIFVGIKVASEITALVEYFIRVEDA